LTGDQHTDHISTGQQLSRHSLPTLLYFLFSPPHIFFNSIFSQPHKWHIWFCPTHKPTLRKTKRAIFQEANLDKLDGVFNQDNINFNKTFGKNNKQISDEDLRKLIQHFNRMNLRDDNLEFPDLMGAAYEYLIKHFADSAGKKAGEFYTPMKL
jgi:type I restriction-modification system DNA methylase subunit